ncbi:MAG TPA: hypothetical protein VHH36_06850, partial [Candidatus Thermoplasmatota archaeon]|nr:hypothetical protein [Candidatus Thermoplasmatota archaeon]
EAGLDETLLFTWLVLPLAVSVIVAARVAGARRTRFVDSLYTTPLSQPTWIAAQAIVGAILGLLALAVQVPFLLVFVAWLGVPAFLPPAALAALGIAAFAVALGLFCGVVVGDSSPLAAAGLAGGIAFVSFILFLVHTIALEDAPTAEQGVLLRVTALSPVSLAADASGLTPGGMKPVETWRPVAGVLSLVAGLGGAAWIAYTRGQGPLGWEPGRGRAAVLALTALSLAAPVATAEVAFAASEDEGGYEPGGNTWVAFVERGGAIREDSFEYSSIHAAPSLPLGEDVEYDVLVLALSPPGADVRGVHIEVKGSDVVRVVAGGQLAAPRGEPAARVPAPNDGQPRPVYRVPVTLRAVSVEELGDSPAPVEVHTSFTADGRRFASVSRMTLAGEVPGAVLHLVGAGLVVPSLALAGFVARRRSTR